MNGSHLVGDNTLKASLDASDNISQSAEALFTIGQMAEQYKITLRALRFYESSGLIHPKRRGTTRLYSAVDRQRLEMILRGRQLGFSLAEIHEFIDTPNKVTNAIDLESLLDPEHVVTQLRLLERQRDDLDKTINALRNIYQKMSHSGDVPDLGTGESLL
jgi:DNA-binding transcriptional MerR regulator